MIVRWLCKRTVRISKSRYWAGLQAALSTAYKNTPGMSGSTAEDTDWMQLGLIRIYSTENTEIGKQIFLLWSKTFEFCVWCEFWNLILKKKIIKKLHFNQHWQKWKRFLGRSIYSQTWGNSTQWAQKSKTCDRKIERV